jgi:probable rRNA maturation factor
MSVELNNESGIPVDEAAVQRLVTFALDLLHVHPDADVAILFVDEAAMEQLHVQWMDEPGPTDVLSFPLDGEDERGLRVLGDVVIAPSVAARNNPDDPGGELRLLVVHGVLHLLGYDHEEDGEKATMWARQTAYSGVEAP